MFVSIIIPIFNEERFLKICLESILAQTGCNLEIICVDDGSTDKSVDIIKTYMKTDRRIKLFKSKHEGVSNARNIGIRHSSGKYIHFIDADDYLKPNCYKTILKSLKTSDTTPDLITFSSEYRDFNDNLTKIVNESSLFLKYFKNAIYIFSKFELMPDFYIYHGGGEANLHGKLFSLQIIKQNHLLFNKRLKFGEDAEFYYRFLPNTKAILSFPHDFYCYRITNGLSYTTTLINDVLVFKNMFYIFENSIKKYKHFTKDVENCFVLTCVQIIYNSYQMISNNRAKIESLKIINNFLENKINPFYKDYFIAKGKLELVKIR